MVQLSENAQAIIRRKLASGEFSSEQAVVEAALHRLAVEDWDGPGPEELKRLVEEADASIRANGMTDGPTAAAKLLADTYARYGRPQ